MTDTLRDRQNRIFFEHATQSHGLGSQTSGSDWHRFTRWKSFCPIRVTSDNLITNPSFEDFTYNASDEVDDFTGFTKGQSGSLISGSIRATQSGALLDDYCMMMHGHTQIFNFWVDYLVSGSGKPDMLYEFSCYRNHGSPGKGDKGCRVTIYDVNATGSGTVFDDRIDTLGWKKEYLLFSGTVDELYRIRVEAYSNAVIDWYVWFDNVRFIRHSELDANNETQYLKNYLETVDASEIGVWDKYKKYILNDIGCGTEFANWSLPQAQHFYYQRIENDGYSGNTFNGFIW